MRYRAIAALLAVSALIPATAAHATESYVCWYVSVSDGRGGEVRGMRCRIDGVLQDLGSPGEAGVAVPLVYDIGYDAVGECYYRRSGPWSGWVAMGAAGSLMNFWWDPDGIPGGSLVGDAWVEPCTSEPTPGTPPIGLVYELIGDYDFVDPVPVVVPDGIGLAGAQSFVDVVPPDPLVTSLVSPVTGVVIDVEIRVVAVAIEWGDGAVVTIPESQFDLFAPHPEGVVGHRWETMGDYVMGVDYVWSARWRVGGGPWQVVAVPDTQWSSPYRVDEIVGRRRG